jgi:hypothetical protein
MAGQIKLKATTKSAIGARIPYCLNQRQNLAAYMQNVHVQMDNNRAERHIKPFCYGAQKLVV